MNINEKIAALGATAHDGIAKVRDSAMNVINKLQTRIAELEAERSAYKQRAEAAEAKLRELEMQEPVAYMTDWDGSRTLSFSHPRIGAITKPLYAKPFPAPKQLPDDAFCAAGVEPCACAIANNLDAARYRALRNQDIESDFPRSGVFIGKVPDNHCLTGIDADNAVDALFPAPKQEDK